MRRPETRNHGRLNTEINIDKFLLTINYDYPNFHLTMHCFLCSVISGNLELLEHENARWLSPSELKSVEWLPADIEVLDFIIDNHI